MNCLWVAPSPSRKPTVWLSVCLMDSMRLPAWKRHHFDMWCAPHDTGSTDTGECHKGDKPPSLAVRFAPPPPGAAALPPILPPPPPRLLPIRGLPSLPGYGRTALQTHTEGSVGGGAPAASIMNWPEWWGHTNSMICIIPVNKLSPCAVVFVQNVLQPFSQQALFSLLPFYYSYYKCVIEFRKLYDSSSVSVLSCVAYLNPWLPA